MDEKKVRFELIENSMDHYFFLPSVSIVFKQIERAVSHIFIVLSDDDEQSIFNCDCDDVNDDNDQMALL